MSPDACGRLRPSAAKMASIQRCSPHRPGDPGAARAPASCNQATPASYAGTLGNTTAGDCTIAGALRLMQSWSSRTTATPLAFTDQQALSIYSTLSGYDPSTGANDTGLVETDVLDYWSKSNFEGNTLAGYSAINPQDVEHVKQAIWVYGGVYLGLSLPETAEQQTAAGQPWDLVWYYPRVLGGHCVVGLEYDENYIYVGTWGVRQPVSWGFFARYFDAAYAPADSLWIGADGRTPGGLGMDGLTADLSYVRRTETIDARRGLPDLFRPDDPTGQPERYQMERIRPRPRRRDPAWARLLPQPFPPPPPPPPPPPSQARLPIQPSRASNFAARPRQQMILLATSGRDRYSKFQGAPFFAPAVIPLRLIGRAFSCTITSPPHKPVSSPSPAGSARPAQPRSRCPGN